MPCRNSTGHRYEVGSFRTRQLSPLLASKIFTAFFPLGNSPNTLNFQVCKSIGMRFFVFVPEVFLILTWFSFVQSIWTTCVVFVDFFIVKRWVFASVWFRVTVFRFHNL